MWSIMLFIKCIYALFACVFKALFVAQYGIFERAVCEIIGLHIFQEVGIRLCFILVNLLEHNLLFGFDVLRLKYAAESHLS